MISRYDEVLAQKTNKTSLLALEKKLREQHALKEELKDATDLLQEKQEEQQARIDKNT